MARDRDETEMFDFQSETRSRPRPSHIFTRPRRDRDVWKLRLETVSRSRRRDGDYIPGKNDLQVYCCEPLCGNLRTNGSHVANSIISGKLYGKTLLVIAIVKLLFRGVHSIGLVGPNHEAGWVPI